jgi:dGTP triphosphohydrolase
MNKEINYQIEYLAKSDDKNALFYQEILEFFKKHLIYTSSKYDLKALKVLAEKSKIEFPISFNDALQKLDKTMQKCIGKDIQEAKQQLFETIIQSNFKKEKELFDKVETSIYKTLSAYIYGLTRAFELFFIYTKENVKDPELFIEYAHEIHKKLVEHIFNKEEKILLETKLKELMSVYLSVYARYLYL